MSRLEFRLCIMFPLAKKGLLVVCKQSIRTPFFPVDCKFLLCMTTTIGMERRKVRKLIDDGARKAGEIDRRFRPEQEKKSAAEWNKSYSGL